MMGLVVSTMIAMAAAEPTLPAQAAHYGRQAEGWTRSRFIRTGMTEDEVRKIMGRDPNGGSFGVINSTFYTPLGVGIVWGWRDDIQELRVGKVGWCSRPFGK